MFIHPLAWNQPLTWVIVLVVVLILFGATRLPALSKSIGQSVKIFRKEMKTDEPSATAPANSEADAATSNDTAAKTDKS
jgi:sec-independent protein translocase protein TatA